MCNVTLRTPVIVGESVNFMKTMFTKKTGLLKSGIGNVF